MNQLKVKLPLDHCPDLWKILILKIPKQPSIDRPPFYLAFDGEEVRKMRGFHGLNNPELIKFI
jgi:hypothetical protein